MTQKDLVWFYAISLPNQNLWNQRLSKLNILDLSLVYLEYELAFLDVDGMLSIYLYNHTDNTNPLSTVEAMNMPEMMILWNIEDSETAISEAMEAASRHEILLQTKGHASKFIRSSLYSRNISHNSYMEQAIRTVVGIELNLLFKDY